MTVVSKQAVLDYERERHPLALLFTLDIRTKNPLNASRIGNTKLAAIIRTQERRAQRKRAKQGTLDALRASGLSAVDLIPAKVRLTRVSAGHMDDDGLSASGKGVRDGIAEALGVNDGGRFISFTWAQRKGPPKVHSIDVLIVRAR
jgi:hypothetical protein